MNEFFPRRRPAVFRVHRAAPPTSRYGQPRRPQARSLFGAIKSPFSRLRRCRQIKPSFGKNDGRLRQRAKRLRERAKKVFARWRDFFARWRSRFARSPNLFARWRNRFARSRGLFARSRDLFARWRSFFARMWRLFARTRGRFARWQGRFAHGWQPSAHASERGGMKWMMMRTSLDAFEWCLLCII